MKLLYLVSHLGEDGPIHALHTIIQGMHLSGIKEITVLTLSPPSKDIMKSKFESEGTRVINFSFNLIKPWQVFFALRRFLRSNNFDVAAATCVRADSILAISSFGLTQPLICTTVQNIPAEDLGYLFPGIKGKVFAALHYWALRQYKGRIICVSNAIKNHLRDQIGASGVRILNPLPQIKHQAFASDPEPVIVFASSLSERKNVEEALRFAVNSELGSEYVFEVYGKGPLEDSLKKNYKHYTNIRWCGFTQELLQILAKSKVYVSASLSEGLPLTPQLALTQGCPCVLSDIPQHREIAEMSPHAHLYRSGDLQDFKRAMQLALNTKRSTLLADANEFAKKLDPYTIAQELLNFYTLKA